jgi:hypothetical protein
MRFTPDGSTPQYSSFAWEIRRGEALMDLVGSSVVRRHS